MPCLPAAASSRRARGIGVADRAASSARITSSVLSGNARSGIFVAAGHVTVKDNRIGVKAHTDEPLPNGASGIYFGLDDVSTAIWALVTRPGGASIAAIRTKMLAEFDVTEEVLDRDLEAFLATLQKRGLVVVSDGPAQSA